MLRFPDLLRAIALGSVGASAGCAGHTIDLSRYDQSVCSAEGKYHPVRGLVGTLGVDYVVLYGGYGTPSVVDEDGKACATATDVAACTTQLGKASTGRGGWGSGEVPMLRFLVTTRGDEVRAYRTLADLRTLLQPVDSAKEAALLLSESGHRIQCNYLNARKVAAGYEIVTETGNTCGGDILRKVTLVRPDGTTAEVDSEVLVEGDSNCAIGRRPEGLAAVGPRAGLGGYFALAAHLEAASIVAFARLASELVAHGAPRALVVATERARRDEIRHARQVGRLARRFGAGPPAVVVGPPPEHRDLEAIALENATEGCVRETFGAVVAAFAAEHAQDPEVQRVLAGIAADEVRHAELSWAVDAWIQLQLEPAARARVAAARDAAVQRLLEDGAPTMPAEVHSLAGYPTPSESRQILERFVPALFAA